MAERTARLGSMHYQDADGRYRTAMAGDKIDVHPDYVERFDRFNVLLGEEPEAVEEKPKPVKRAPSRRKDSKDDSE